MITNPERVAGLNKSSAFTIQTPATRDDHVQTGIRDHPFLCSFFLFCSLKIIFLQVLHTQDSLCGSLYFCSLCFFAGSCWATVVPRLRRFAPCCMPIPRPVIGPFPCGPVPSLPGIETLLIPDLAPYSLICA